MGTQAVVSIVRDGKSVVKAITGCNGALALDLAKVLRSKPDINTAQAVYDIAISMSYGCKDCLVVLDQYNGVFHGGEPIGVAHRSAFDQPKWNSRWEHGTAAYVEIVERTS